MEGEKWVYIDMVKGVGGGGDLVKNGIGRETYGLYDENQGRRERYETFFKG